MSFGSVISLAKSRRTGGFVRQLQHDDRGVAFTEFAVSLPVLLVFMASGLELANYVITSKRVGEVSTAVADNASRIGLHHAIENMPISEAEINDVFIGAELQAGKLDIARNSRIILSSLERNADGGQKIAWQRCFGALPHHSSYGNEGDGASGTGFTGMGPVGNQVTAAPNTAVMVVEIAYRYERVVPVIGLPLGEITEIAAFNIRDNRTLDTILNTEGVEVSSCD